MARAIFTNNARTTLSAGINNSVTSIAVVNGSVFPSPSAGDYAYLTIEEGATVEVVQLTARSGNTLTVVRARDGTSGATFTAAATVSLRLPKIVLDEIWTGIDGKVAKAGDTISGTLHFSASEVIDRVGDDQFVRIKGYQNENGGASLILCGQGFSAPGYAFVDIGGEPLVGEFHVRHNNGTSVATIFKIDRTGVITTAREIVIGGVTPGLSMLDNSSNTISLNNGNQIAMPSFSGLVIINSHTNGRNQIFIVGAGSVTSLGFAGAALNGTLSYNGGTGQYLYTHSGSAETYTFTLIKTRAGA